MGGCTKKVFTSRRLALAVAKQMSRRKGKRCRIHKCFDHGVGLVWHTTTRNGGQSPTSSKGDPVQARFRKKRYLVRKFLPEEVWEGEGGALRPERYER